MNNIILIGMMGCGKTVVGQSLADYLQMNFVDMDKYLEEKYQMTIPEMFAISEDYFRERETECVRDIEKFSDTVVSCGGGVITREINIELLRKFGTVIYIDRPIADIVKDVDCLSRPLLKDGPDKIIELDKKRRPLYLKAAHYRVVNEQCIDTVVMDIAGIFKQKQ